MSGRRRELAIRCAFGATRRHLVLLLCGEELRPVLLGLVLGLLTAGAFAPMVLASVFETSVWDPVTYFMVAAALLAAGSIASYLPARRAAGTDPAELLR